MSQTHSRLKIVFMGTPEFAACILRHLLECSFADVVAVYTQPDRPAGRGHKLTPSAVKLVAQEAGIPLFQPPHFKNEEDRAALAALSPDILVVAAYGLLLPASVLAIPRHAPINVHASLLPRYRGAAPIQRAIMDGESETGVSIMRMEETLDTGPVYEMRSCPTAGHTAASLHDSLAVLGAESLLSVLNRFCDAEPASVPQDDTQSTYAPKMTRADGYINWELPCAVIDARIRAVTPWPGARVLLHMPEREALPLLLFPGKMEENTCQETTPGTLRWDKQGLCVATGDVWYRLSEIQPAGRARMDGRAFVNGFLKPFASLANNTGEEEAHLYLSSPE